MATTKTPIAKKVTSASKAPAKGFPARRPGTAAKKPAGARKNVIPLVKAPADFKPHFLLVQFTTEKDGLIASQVEAVRYQGKFDREADDKKKWNMSGYDYPTLVGIAARFSAITYKPSVDKKFPISPKERAAVKGGHRLPASSTFQVLLRVGKRAADQSLTAGVRQVFQALENPKTGRRGLKELEKTDPLARALRRASRILPAAFANVQMPPKKTRRRADADSEE